MRPHGWPYGPLSIFILSIVSITNYPPAVTRIDGEVSFFHKARVYWIMDGVRAKLDIPLRITSGERKDRVVRKRIPKERQVKDQVPNRTNSNIVCFILQQTSTT